MMKLKKCKVCNRTLLRSAIHHIDGNHDNNEDKNIILLCLDCHITIHKGFGSRSRRGRIRDYKTERCNVGKNLDNEFHILLVRRRIKELRSIWYNEKQKKRLRK